MRRAEFQGLHFRYAAKNGETFIEIRRDGRYYLWLLCDDGMKLIDATVDTRLPGGLAVVGEKKLGQSAPISS